MSIGQAPDYTTFAGAIRLLGVDLTPEHYEKLLAYAQLVVQWNEHINLISRRDTARILTYHIIDSIAAARFIPAGSYCADVGSGAGLPGIPLSVIRPDIRVALIESIKKKCLFLKQTARQLQLANTTVLGSRAENLPTLKCDILLSRLTAGLSKTLVNTHHHLKSKGVIILYKLANWEDELKKQENFLTRLNMRYLKTEKIRLPFTGIERYLVLLIKI